MKKLQRKQEIKKEKRLKPQEQHQNLGEGRRQLRIKLKTKRLRKVMYHLSQIHLKKHPNPKRRLLQRKSKKLPKKQTPMKRLKCRGQHLNLGEERRWLRK